MKVLITGATGFIGRNLAEALPRSFEIFSLSQDDLDLVNADAVSSFFRGSAPFDAVVHCAAKGVSRTNPCDDKALNDNVAMFYNLHANRSFFGKMISLGSGAEYDKSRDLVDVKEDVFGERFPKDPYGVYKYRCARFIENSNTNIVNLRFFGVYGKYEDYGARFISNAICRSLLGLDIVVNRNVFFEYVFVEDAVRVIEHFLRATASYKAYNIGTGKKISLVELARLIKNITGNPHPIRVKNEGLNPEYTCDSSRLRNEIPGIKFTEHSVAIKSLYLWYRERIDFLDKDRICKEF